MKATQETVEPLVRVFKAAVNTIIPRSPFFAFCTPKYCCVSAYDGWSILWYDRGEVSSAVLWAFSGKSSHTLCRS